MTLDRGGSEIAELPSDRYIPAPEDTAEEISEQPEPPAPPAEEGGDPQLTLWRQFLGKVREQSMSIYSFLEKGRFCGVQSGQMIICFDDGNSYNKTHLERREIRMLLEETLKSIAGDPLRIKLIIERGDTGTPSHPGEPEPEQVKATRREEARKQSVEKALENPIVKKTAELFRGKIVYVSG
jgi:hypothetical protein